MTTSQFRRPPRMSPPEMPGGELSLQEPPVLPEAGTGNLSMMLTYLPMAIGSTSMILIFVNPGSNALTWLAGGLMSVTMLSMVLGQAGRASGDRKRRMRGERRDYLRYLAQTRSRVRELIDKQRAAAAWGHPDPGALWNVALSRRLWERRPGDQDFGELRAGTGPQRLAARIAPPQTKPVEDLEPLSARALRRFIHAYSTVDNLPVAVYLRGFAQLVLRGEPATARDLARALIGQLAAFHSPDDVRIVVCAAPGRAADWDWVKWLPHALDPGEHDAAGARRLITTGLDAAVELLGPAFAERPRFDPAAVPTRDEPFTVLVLDGVAAPDGCQFADSGYRNAVLVEVAGELPWRGRKTTLRLDATATALEMVRVDRNGREVRDRLGVPDRLSAVRAGALARCLAPWRLSAQLDVSEPLVTDFDLAALLRIDDPAGFDPRELWRQRGPADRLRVPIGIGEDGSPVELDIKESAQGGMGPHGVLIGATGSGKSELLRTLVLAMALTHSSETLNFVLVDFKGGATFLGLDALPHTSAVITNLADELPLVARMQDALQGELNRRQELLRKAGGYSSVLDYERARAQGAALDPLPTLFVIVDEFSELLSAHREFIDLFVMIGRLGRSLGVHLLLASQRLDDGRIHQLESHLSYRIGLRTFSAVESRSVIGVPDAYELPPAPGSGYLRMDVSTLVRFKAAYVSGAYRAPTRQQRQEAAREQVVAFGAAFLGGRATPEPEAAPEPGPTDPSGSLLQVAVDRLRGAGPPAHQVWLPPLAAPPSLDDLLPPLAPVAGHGFAPADPAARGRLVVPVGVVDRPYEQQRDLLVADVSGAGGHVGVVGGPQSGKSNLLRTFVHGLALTHSPREAQVYCLDFGGGTLAPLAGLPHVGGMASRLDTDRVHRTIAEITALLTARERRFAAEGIASMAAYRQLRRSGRHADDPYGDVFLVIDGWLTFKQEFEAQEIAIRQLASRTLNYGVHLVLASNRWSEIHSTLRDQLGTRFELRLGDPVDSAIDIRAAKHVPAVPGRGLTADKLHFLAAVPRLGGLGGDEADLVATVADHWDGPNAPAVRMLPDRLPVADLPAPEDGLRVALGLDEAGLAPVWHDFSSTAHLTVIGDTESGKTNLLRLILRGIAARHTPDQARVLLVDLRRELYDAIGEEHRLGYAVSAAVVGQLAGQTADGLRKRIPDENVTPDQLRRRDWWTGPELYLVIDDYDLLTTAGASPFAPLLDLIPQGRDIGLHVVLARGAAGAARGMMDPLLRRLSEANAPELALSCPPSEGPLLGNVRPRQFPPGRGMLLTRRGHTVLQTARMPEL